MRAAAAVLAVGACALGASATAGAGQRAPARLMVSAQEYSLMLSRQNIRSGPALIQFLNRGEDPHDLRLRRMASGGISARRTFAIPETPSTGLAELAVPLPAGRYRLWCSIPGHRALGMRATLRVNRR